MKRATNLLKQLLALVVLLNVVQPVVAEGTKQLIPRPDLQVNLEILNPTLTKFASYLANPNERLYISIADPGREKIHFGFGQVFSDNFVDSSSFLQGYFRIKDPNGNVVIGPEPIPRRGRGYIRNYEEAVAGPRALAGATGYDGFVYQPLLSGDYYIEFNPDNPTTPPPANVFNRNFAIRHFDITVERDGQARDGRLWSKNWDMNANSINNPVYTKFYIYSSDSIVTLFDMNGCRPFGFSVTCNRTGLTNTGDVEFDRRSRDYKYYYPEYKIFLNDPDPLLFPSGIPAKLNVQPRLAGCDAGRYCISLVPDKLCYCDMYIELNGQPGYQANTRDVRFNRFLLSGPNCVNWNGLDGLGNKVRSGTQIQVQLDIIAGLANYSIYDAEFNPIGFKSRSVRPSALPNKMYFDDSNIPFGNTNLDGCDSNCHTWLATPADIVDPMVGSPYGFGNVRSLNTWWSGYTRNYAFTARITDCDDPDNIVPPRARVDSFVIANTTRFLDIYPHRNNTFPKGYDPRTITIIKFPKHGTIAQRATNGANNGDFTYIPKAGLTNERDTILYYVCDFNNPPLCALDTIIIRIVPFLRIGDIRIPDGFSPNGDEFNNTFRIGDIEAMKIELSVYNRWGSLVYKDEEYKNNWDGHANEGLVAGGGPVPDGTYFIVVKLKDTNESVVKYITIRR
jgi:gliding motility-associated-like protein